MTSKIGAILIALLVALGAGASEAAELFRVTLLGTGTPVPLTDRFGPSTLIEAGDQKLLVDAGRGVPIRLWQLRIPTGRIDVLFLTHLHSDHTSGIPDVWLNGWLPTAYGLRKSPFHVIGPVGTRDMMANIERAYAEDIKFRTGGRPTPGAAIAAEDFPGEGVVYEKEGLRVTAFTVDHVEAKPAYGFRFDYDGKSIVISGDTRFNENVIKYGTGATILVHEVAAAKPEFLKIPGMQAIMDLHTSPREAGIVFSRAHPKMAVFTHIALLQSATIPPPSIEEIVAETRETYQGPFAVGEDLMTLDASGDGVAVYRRGQN